MKRIILIAAGLVAVGASTAILLLRRRAAKRAELEPDLDAIIDEVVVHFEPFDEPLGTMRY